MGTPLIPFQTTQVMCSKCGAMANTRKYCQGLPIPNMDAHPWRYMLGQIHGCTEVGDHLHVICDRCGYHTLMHTYEHAQALRGINTLMSQVEKSWPPGQQEEQ